MPMMTGLQALEEVEARVAGIKVLDGMVTVETVAVVVAAVAVAVAVMAILHGSS